MNLNELGQKHGATHANKRVGRGTGSGLGKTSGRGQKGQRARTGVAIGGFEGGQMPLHMRLPKRGFNNPRAARFQEVNLGRVQAAVDAGKLDPKQPVNVLKAAGVIRRGRDGVRLLGNGTLKAKLTFEVAGASRAAAAAVEGAGGTLVVPAVRPPLKTGKRHERRAHAQAKARGEVPAADAGGKAKGGKAKGAKSAAAPAVEGGGEAGGEESEA